MKLRNSEDCANQSDTKYVPQTLRRTLDIDNYFLFTRHQ